MHDVDVVVNCLWKGRRHVDKQMGIDQWSGDNVRLKFGIKSGYVQKLKHMPSMTIVNGAYGDFVNYPKDNRMYFSWYPYSMTGMVVNDTDISKDWEAIASGNVPDELKTHQLNAHVKKFNELFVNLGFEFENPLLVGGFILGNGKTDIQDVNSGLHKRADQPIIHDRGYFSVSTQKFTLAPYNAYLMEKDYLMHLS